MKLIQPVLKDDALMDDIWEASTESDIFYLWWLGQSGYLLQWGHKHLLLDPYLSDSLTKKYAATDKPHIRMTERVIEPCRLDFIDIITSSHNHTDHLDAETLIPVIKVNPEIKMIIPEANRAFVADRLHINSDFFIGLDDGKTVVVNDFWFTGIPAAHDEMERDENGHCKFLGYIIQFGNWTVYHSGDTLWHDEIIKKLAPFYIDVAILPINGHDPKRKVAGNLNAEEAVALAAKIEAKVVIPCHYDMFTFNTSDPADFVRAAKEMGQPFRILKCGERWSSDLLPP